MAKKEKQKSIVSPEGTFKWPRLGPKPDMGTKEHPKPDGEFNTKLVFSKEEAEELERLVGPAHKEAVKEGERKFNAKPAAKRKGKPFVVNEFMHPVYDEDDNETGEFEVSFKMKASGKTKEGERWTRTLPRFDAKGKPLSDKVMIYGGSKGRVSFFIDPYFIDGTNMAGISLRMAAVKVNDLVTGGVREASAYGFEAEDGYEAEDSFDEDEDSDSVDEAEDEDELDDEIPF